MSKPVGLPAPKRQFGESFDAAQPIARTSALRKRHRMDLGLKGRVAIVAAASTGLGRAVARELSKEGANVAICARTAATLERTANEIHQETGGDILHKTVDVTKESEIAAFVAATEQRFGKVDICVTNSGGPPSKLFADTQLDDWRS